MAGLIDGHTGPLYCQLASQLPDSVLMQIIALAGMQAPPCRMWLNAFVSMLTDPQQLAAWLVALTGSRDAALKRAVRGGKVDTVRNLLGQGADLHADGGALRVACYYGQVEVARLLLDQGADLFKPKGQPLRFAAKRGHLEVVRLLLDRGADPHPKHTRDGSSEEEEEADEEAEEEEEEVDEEEDTDDEEENVEFYDVSVWAVNDWYPLYAATAAGQFAVVNLLLDRGAPLHSRVLDYAASPGNVAMLSMLADRGADLHIWDDRLARIAAEVGGLEVVRFLFDRGANLHAMDCQILHCATGSGNVELVRFLLDHGVDVHDLNGQVLVTAAQSGFVDMVRLLLEHGASVHARDALNAAAYMGHIDVVRLLLEHVDVHVVGPDALAQARAGLQDADPPGRVWPDGMLCNAGGHEAVIALLQGLDIPV